MLPFLPFGQPHVSPVPHMLPISSRTQSQLTQRPLLNFEGGFSISSIHIYTHFTPDPTPETPLPSSTTYPAQSTDDIS